MTGAGDKKGLIIFGAILFIIVVAALIAYQMTGSMGIEERYSHAVGLPGSEEESGGGWLGFSLEGNPFLYLAALGGLVVGAFALYRFGRRR